jgi:nitroimidazol reductase NimA-like FMN-containing flavoprotein (pyridoxamine 5'-phosphate oxidase superfamily)
MFREVRRKDLLVSQEDAIQMLSETTAGVLGVNGDDGYPYTVPVNFVYHDGKIYFHCAKAGHMIDAIKNCSKVTFCVIHKMDRKQEEFTTDYRSVSIFGRARILEAETEKREAMIGLIKKYSPDFMDIGMQKINRGCNACLVEIQIEHMTAKVKFKM